MVKIAHRANVNGPSPDENTMTAAIKALINGYDVELDVRTVGGQLWLGHDSPTEMVTDDFLERTLLLNVWWHCKDKESFDYFLNEGSHCFWHDEDDYALTSSGVVWAHPKVKLRGDLSNTVLVMPERSPHNVDLKGLYGVCTDWPDRY